MSDVEQTKEPKVVFKKMTFNDGTSLVLKEDSVVVFTGSNNSGKSQILRDIERVVDGNYGKDTIVLADCELEYRGSIENTTFLNSFFKTNKTGYYELPLIGAGFSKESLKNYWSQHTLVNGLSSVFVKRLGTERRITLSDPMDRSRQPERSPIFKLNNDEKLASKISELFYQAFGEDLIVNRNEISMIPLHVGKAPNKKKFTMDEQDEYYRLVSMLPKLHEQGDGMRSYASVLLDTFTSNYSITLIDEPEAFLHPPQARLLGKMLAQNNPTGRQLFISTHSEDFLQGMLDADSDNVTVVRMDRQESINKMSILNNTEIKKLWGNPILKYSNILGGLFHDKVVVCESDYDCLFYQALIDSIHEKNNDVSPDILFTHCGGKARIKDVVLALKAVNVSVVAITDFDILNDSRNLKPLTAAFGLGWKTELEEDMRVIYDTVNGQRSEGVNPWDNLKKCGKMALEGDAPSAYENLELKFKNNGLFIVPFGEMESFDKTVNKEKKEWVYYVLENYELGTEPKLENARRFVEEIVAYR